MESKNAEEPFFKIEIEKNAEYKKKIIILEKELLEVNTQVEGLDIVNEFLVDKKEKIVAERKKLIQTNDDLRREIEAKSQLNDIRIQKKVKENNSEEILKLESHLQGVIKNINDLESKISTEVDKTKMFSLEIIRLNLDLKYKEEKRETVIDSVDRKLKDLSELKDHLETLKTQHYEIKYKVSLSNLINLI